MPEDEEGRDLQGRGGLLAEGGLVAVPQYAAGHGVLVARGALARRLPPCGAVGRVRGAGGQKAVKRGGTSVDHEMVVTVTGPTPSRVMLWGKVGCYQMSSSLQHVRTAPQAAEGKPRESRCGHQAGRGSSGARERAAARAAASDAPSSWRPALRPEHPST